MCRPAGQSPAAPCVRKRRPLDKDVARESLLNTEWVRKAILGKDDGGRHFEGGVRGRQRCGRRPGVP